jgi:hypothetical protein
VRGCSRRTRGSWWTCLKTLAEAMGSPAQPQHTAGVIPISVVVATIASLRDSDASLRAAVNGGLDPNPALTQANLRILTQTRFLSGMRATSVSVSCDAESTLTPRPPLEGDYARSDDRRRLKRLVGPIVSCTAPGRPAEPLLSPGRRRANGGASLPKQCLLDPKVEAELSPHRA